MLKPIEQRMRLLGLVMSVLGACQSAQPAAATRPAPAELVRGPSADADVAAFVAAEVAKASAQQRRVLVYVGASWCEPCRRFHDALRAGELAQACSGLRFIEFDYDADGAALRRAGYVSKLIPLFALPNADGTASERHIEGSIKGPSAVTLNLLPRLSSLLADSATSR